jgi:antitoxin HicB
MLHDHQRVFVYPVLLEQAAADEIIARVAGFPEVLTSGRTPAEAVAAAQDALDEAVLARLADGREVPLSAASQRQDDLAYLDPLTGARVMVDVKRREAGMSKSDLARAMGKDEKVVRRILDGRGSVTIETVLEALKALGVKASLVYS